MVDGHPEVFPVNHVYDRERGCFAFPTNSGTEVHAALGWPWVAFEVDGIDPDGSGGWNVPWRAGSRVRWLRIVPSKVTGRRICAGDRGITLGMS
jgi:hypothetical protein